MTTLVEPYRLDIERAPRDGTCVGLLLPNDHEVLGRWRDGGWEALHEDAWLEVSERYQPVGWRPQTWRPR